MKNLLTFILIIALTYTAKAQGIIAVQEDSVTVEFYNDLATAFDSAAPNSTVYLPGGGFILSTSYIINKPLNIIGVGYNTDSTQATNQTVLPQIRFGSGADGSSITGCYITSYIRLDTLNNLSIKRCNFYYLRSYGQSTNISIVENIIRYPSSSDGINYSGNNIGVGSLSSCLISKNIIMGGISFVSQSVFSNNLILYSYSNTNVAYTHAFKGISSSIFNNNYIFNLAANYTSNVSSSVFNNNIVLVENNNTTNISNNTLTGQPPSATFENAPSYNVLYSDIQYQIKSTSPAKTHATDGGEIGIFGTTKPWKIGGLPDNPHVYFINVADENTGANGTLPVEIGVSGQ